MVSNVKINDSSGVTRDIWVRYIHEYPVENNDWGDFQAHRRLLGLVTIGKFESQTESLQAGLVKDVLNLYHNACETLRAIGDALWVGASEEGLCSASIIFMYPHLRYNETLHRNTSLQDGSPTLLSATERLRAIDTTVKMHASKHNSHDDLQDNMPTGQMTSASSFCSSVSSILTTNSLPSGTPTSSSSTSTISAAQHGAIATELPNNQCRTPLKSCSISSPVSVNIYSLH